MENARTRDWLQRERTMNASINGIAQSIAANISYRGKSTIDIERLVGIMETEQDYRDEENKRDWLESERRRREAQLREYNEKRKRRSLQRRLDTIDDLLTDHFKSVDKIVDKNPIKE